MNQPQSVRLNSVKAGIVVNSHLIFFDEKHFVCMHLHCSVRSFMTFYIIVHLICSDKLNGFFKLESIHCWKGKPFATKATVCLFLFWLYSSKDKRAITIHGVGKISLSSHWVRMQKKLLYGRIVWHWWYGDELTLLSFSSGRMC